MIQAIITFLHNLDWPSFIVGLFLGFVGTFMQDRAFPFLNRKRILYDESKKAPAVLVQEQLLKDLDWQKTATYIKLGSAVCLTVPGATAIHSTYFPQKVTLTAKVQSSAVYQIEMRKTDIP